MTQTTRRKTKHRPAPRKRLTGIQIAVLIVGVLVFAVAASFGGYLIYEEAQHQRALRNYPVAYADLIQTYAEEYELDPYLVQSVIRCESSNDPEAVSRVGAIGLMQIMPDTGEWIAHKLDLDSVYTQDMLYDPATNIEFGCWYLRFLNGRFDGVVMEMIAAYNAGHGTVEGWLEDPRFSQNGKLLTIPYEDTARYYENVMEAFENYTTLYPDEFAEKIQSASVVGG